MIYFMKKVMCIHEGEWIDNEGLVFTGPKFLEDVLVTQCQTWHHNYVVQGYGMQSDGREYSYRKENFIPLSEIDETKLINNKELQIYKRKFKVYARLS
jgi:hypothetical protein